MNLEKFSTQNSLPLFSAQRQGTPNIVSITIDVGSTTNATKNEFKIHEKLISNQKLQNAEHTVCFISFYNFYLELLLFCICLCVHNIFFPFQSSLYFILFRIIIFFFFLLLLFLCSFAFFEAHIYHKIVLHFRMCMRNVK